VGDCKFKFFVVDQKYKLLFDKLMEKLQKFHPILASCSQGQKRRGVEQGGMYVYNNLVKDICESQPYKLEHT
jgi:hypothetical protein